METDRYKIELIYGYLRIIGPDGRIVEWSDLTSECSTRNACEQAYDAERKAADKRFSDLLAACKTAYDLLGKDLAWQASTLRSDILGKAIRDAEGGAK